MSQFYSASQAAKVTVTAQQIMKKFITGNYDIRIHEKFHNEHKIVITYVYSSVFNATRLKDIEVWCRETFGEEGHNRKYRWRINYRGDKPFTIFLRNTEDVLLFILKWS